MANNAQIAADVLAAVGGKENVSSVTHCMTRLRFILKDAGVPKDDEVKKIKGVIGVAKAGGQYQVIIGQNVASVISGFLTGLVAGFTHLTAYVMSTANGIYSFAAFFGGPTSNYIALAVTCVAGTIFGFITMSLLKIDESLVPED